MAKVTVAQAAARARPRARRRTARVPASVTLGLWRAKRMWPLLALAQLGVLASVALLCAVPLFARVATVAGLRSALTSSPNIPWFSPHGATNDPSQAHLDDAERRITAVLRQDFAPFGLDTPPTVALTTDFFPFSMAGAAPSGGLALYGTPEATLADTMRVLRGRLPLPAATGLEVALPAGTAQALGADVGSRITLGNPSAANSTLVPLTVVGIVEPSLPAAHSYTLQTNNLEPIGYDRRLWAVVSTDAVSRSPIQWGAIDLGSKDFRGPPDQRPAFWTVTWSYRAALTHLEQIDLSDPEHYQKLRWQSGVALQGPVGLSQFFVDSGAPDLLYTYATRVMYAQVLTFLLLLVAVGLALLFMGVMARALVERQAALIATLRSRGASIRQISGAFLGQGVSLGIVALLAGPLLALVVVRAVAGALLPAESRGALAALGGNPLEVAAGVLPVALVAAVVTVIGMLWAVRRAAKRNILSLRQEATRASGKPLWQRLYLDVVAALLALLGYGAFTLATALGTAGRSMDAERTSYSIAPLALLAPPFLAVAAALLFLRLFPLAVRVGERLALRRPGAAPMLALAQLARASQRATGIILLLALSACFALLTLDTTTTTAQRVQDVAAHRAGADFSGGVAGSSSGGQPRSARNLVAAYEAVPGVVAASAGYRANVTQMRLDFSDPTRKPINENPPIIQIVAVEPDTFARTALWNEQDSPTPLADLTAALRAARAQATATGVVPALVDAQLWKTLGLREGAMFSLPTPYRASGELRYVALRRVENIPTTMASTGFNFGPAAGGILVDYETFAAAYARATADTSAAPVAPNFVWLKTKDDATSLASVRDAVAGGPLRLADLQLANEPSPRVADRRALIATLRSDPMYLNVTGALGFGAVAGLLLALVGVLVSTWLWAREQTMALALLRALGMVPRQVRRVLLWEQGLVAFTALVVGGALGVAMTVVVTPTLVDLMFTSNLGSAVYGVVQGNGPPVRLAFSAPLIALLLGGLALACGMMAAGVAGRAMRSAGSQTLRLSED